MRTRHVSALIVLVTICSSIVQPDSATADRRWSREQASRWATRRSWRVGCNFIPSTAINQLEMWQAETFDPETIDRELGWASQIGFNSVRVFLHNLLWQQDRDGFLRRMERFLEIADRHQIGVLFVLLDGVWDPQPKPGPQPAPRPHVHNSGWVQAPGAAILDAPSRHDRLRPYIQGVIQHFRNDPRIDGWDLFNEPDNPNTNSYGEAGSQTELPPARKEQMARLLLQNVFRWARAAQPNQPLTAGVWRGDWSNPGKLSPINRLMLDQSDVISFHCYGNLEHMRRCVEALRRYGRPILCTEYMARGNGCTFDPVLKFLKEQNVGAYNWGLVAGKTQTQYPWASWRKKFTAEPKLWHHDIFRPDGTPYDPAEIALIQKLTGKAK
ncbi:MAG: cellulase family glycosylhydrolase [Planctomycetes bacterium]|nr:cellulase family glycosylhydrolase [Planctomycetota bacterium]